MTKNQFSKSQLIIVGTLCLYFLTGVCMNILTMKTLQIASISIFTCGILLTPINFACNDILTECCGEKFAWRCILIGGGVNLGWALLTLICTKLPGNNPYLSECFATILGSTIRITSASLIAFVGGGYLNNKIMSKLHQKDGDKGYYKRAILSSFVGQLFDDYVFVFLAFAPFGISAIENPWKAIITVPIFSCLVEVAVEALITPVSHKVCKKYQKNLVKELSV